MQKRKDINKTMFQILVRMVYSIVIAKIYIAYCIPKAIRLRPVFYLTIASEREGVQSKNRALTKPFSKNFA